MLLWDTWHHHLRGLHYLLMYMQLGERFQSVCSFGWMVRGANRRESRHDRADADNGESVAGFGTQLSIVLVSHCQLWSSAWRVGLLN